MAGRARNSGGRFPAEEGFARWISRRVCVSKSEEWVGGWAGGIWRGGGTETGEGS